MKTETLSVQEILGREGRYLVPLYQRRYQWDDNFLSPFWDDIETKAVDILNGCNQMQHYMGALILYPLETEREIPVFHIVDGQQRLITFQLFFAALREVARNDDLAVIMTKTEQFLFNASDLESVDGLGKSKLIPSPPDRAIYFSIVAETHEQVQGKHSRWYHGSRVPRNTPRLALRAYEEFFHRIRTFAAVKPDSDDCGANKDRHETDNPNSRTKYIELRLSALLEAILEQMKLVIIMLGKEDDAQVIFEALNSKNQPLQTMDLVRNSIFYRAEKQGASAEKIYEELWRHFNEDWWQEKIGSPKRHRIDHFLACVLAAQTGTSIGFRDLYWKYRAFIDKSRDGDAPRFTAAMEEMGLLRLHAPNYEALEGRRDGYTVAQNPTLNWLGRKLSDWKIRTAYPIMLQVVASQLSEEEQERIAQLVYSYIVRREICGHTDKKLNLVFRAISQKFLKDGQPQPSYSTLLEFFLSREGASSIFPSDAEFKDAILNVPLFKHERSTGTKFHDRSKDEKIKDILWELELASRPETEREEKPFSFQLEHIFPPNFSWSQTNTLGNLTILEHFPSAAGERFHQKREKYRLSVFALNKWVAEQESWTEDEIRKRGAFLAEKAVEIWCGIKE